MGDEYFCFLFVRRGGWGGWIRRLAAGGENRARNIGRAVPCGGEYIERIPPSPRPRSGGRVSRLVRLPSRAPLSRPVNDVYLIVIQIYRHGFLLTPIRGDVY